MDGGAPVTVQAALDRAVALGGGGLRLCDRNERERFLAWPEIRARALAVAGRLAALGVGRGERVALVFPTGAEFFDAFFGALAAGAVPVPLYPPVRLGRLDEYHRRTAAMIGAAGARLVLADRRVRRILGETVARSRPPLGCLTLDALPPATPLATLAEAAPEELALVQYSSGTTVEPKPVALSHRAVMAQTVILNGFWPDDPAGGDGIDGGGVERVSGVSWLPLYHDMGLIGCIFPALERPAELTLLPPEAFIARPALWLRAISRHRAVVSPAPNFAYSLCLSRIRDEEMEGVDLSSWRVALNGAEAVAPRVLRAFGERFAHWGLRANALTPVYGLSEAALAVTFSDLGRPFRSRRFGREALAGRGVARPEPNGGDGIVLPSLGRPLPGFAVAVLPDGSGEEGPASPDGGAGDAEPPGGRASSAPPAFAVTPPRPSGGLPAHSYADPPAPPLPEARVGRIWVAGPSLMSGYLGRPAATAEALRCGWLDTGDLGFLLDGELYLAGRAKDVIILRGRNHAPDEIEQALTGVAGARPGCAVAAGWMSDDERSERLLVFVEAARDAAREAIEALPAACRNAVLAATGLEPDRVVALPPGTLPRTSSGKLRRRETLRRHLAGELKPPAPVNPLRLAGALARSRLAFARARLTPATGEGEG